MTKETSNHMDHHERVVGAASVNDFVRNDQLSGGIRAEGSTVTEPLAPGMVKWTTTVWLRPAFTSIGTASSHTGPSAPKATGGPLAPVAKKWDEALAGRLTATKPTYSP